MTASTSDIVTCELATCAVCFREFRLNERGRLFTHVRRLGYPERCEGSRFQPAGISLQGTLWALDQITSQLARLEQEHLVLHRQPLLEGVGPFDGMYEALLYQKQHFTELKLKATRIEVDRLSAAFNEWRLGDTIPGPTRIHLHSLWKCRAGTSVPLCYSSAPRRPGGDPIVVHDAGVVDCSACREAIR